MAKLIQAIAAYAPKIELIEAVDPDKFMTMITRRTTLSSGVVKNVQESEVETLIDFLTDGRPVHTGVAIFTPVIDTQGNLTVSVRVDKRILAALNIPGAFKGTVNNSENIGKTSEEFAVQWNDQNPDNLIENTPAPTTL